MTALKDQIETATQEFAKAQGLKAQAPSVELFRAGLLAGAKISHVAGEPEDFMEYDVLEPTRAWKGPDFLPEE